MPVSLDARAVQAAVAPIVALLLFLLAGVSAAQNQPSVTFDTAEIAVETAAGERHVFQVELAVRREQFGQGLMFRQEMADDAGMLFILPRPQTLNMWMKNTYLPLDMLFLNTGGEIVKIAERTVPLSTDRIPSGRPVKGVLEVNAGTAERLGLAVGDRVLHPAFQ